MTTRGRLLETVNGIPIYAKADPGADALALLPGRRGRLARGGPAYEVDRVTEGAAYVHKVYDPPLVKEVGDTEARSAAADVLLAALEDPGLSLQKVYAAAWNAAHAARAVRQITITRGPAEPGICRSARFVERAEDGAAPRPAPAPAPRVIREGGDERVKAAERKACSQAAVAAGFVPGIEFNARGYWRALREWCAATGKVTYPGAGA